MSKCLINYLLPIKCKNTCTALIPAFPKSMSYIRFLGLAHKGKHNGEGELITNIFEIYYLAIDKKSVWVKALKRHTPASVIMSMQARYIFKNIENKEYYFYVLKEKKSNVSKSINR